MKKRDEPQWQILQLTAPIPGWVAIYRHRAKHIRRVRAIACWALIATGASSDGRTFVVGMVYPGKGAGALERADLSQAPWQLVGYRLRARPGPKKPLAQVRASARAYPRRERG
jgi:hypothetical protein